MKKQKKLSDAAKAASKAFGDLGKAFAGIQDKRSRFEKLIDKVSNYIFGNKSCMPNELKSFR